jgi:tetratricopeptide (TPR) repeat protein
MSRIFPSSLLLVAIAVLVVGCKKKLPDPDPDPDAADPAPPVEHTGLPLTEQDYQEFGQSLEKAVATGDKATVDRLLRLMDPFERSFSDLNLTSTERRDMLAGAASGAGQFANQFIEIVKNGGSYSVVRVRTVGGRPRVILRLLQPEGAINYHEFTLVRYPDGQVGAEDIYIYLSAEPLTQTFRRAILGILAERNRGAIARLSESEQALTKHLPSFVTMSQQFRNGQHKEALATFRRLPAELQKNKAFQLMAIQAAQKTGDDEDYIAEIERFRRDHPTDPAADLISIDYYIFKNQYDEALSGLDRLDAAVGGDPYLNVMRAEVLSEAGRYKEAGAAAAKAIEAGQMIEQMYWIRITAALKEKYHADTLAWLKKGVESGAIQIDLGNLRADPEYADFVKSPQFEELKAWLAERDK